jgi:hypothetical protein
MATFTPIELDENGKEICGCICHKHPPHTVMHCVPCCPTQKPDPKGIFPVVSFNDEGATKEQMDQIIETYANLSEGSID